ncbi:1-acylglycerol-3-phosphate O [Wallemia mellicola]|nr:1-acylglycerol-3-phosphate O [Wallemia mellicola]
MLATVPLDSKPQMITKILGLISIPLIVLPKSRYSIKMKLVIHTLIYTTGLAVNSIIGLLCGLIAYPLGTQYRQQLSHFVARSFYYTFTPVLGWNFVVKDEEKLLEYSNNKKSSIIISNHQTMLDILFLSRIFPNYTTMMAKQELKKIPLLGWWMSLSKSVFINRSDRTGAISSFNRIANEIKDNGINVWIFPEGTRSSTKEPSLLPFKKGAFHLAIQAQIPLVPVLCENYYHLANFDKKDMKFERGTVQIKVLDPIPTKGLTSQDVQQLIDYTHSYMLYHLKLLSAESSNSEPPAPFTLQPPSRSDDDDLVVVEK